MHAPTDREPPPLEDQRDGPIDACDAELAQGSAEIFTERWYAPRLTGHLVDAQGYSVPPTDGAQTTLAALIIHRRLEDLNDGQDGAAQRRPLADGGPHLVENGFQVIRARRGAKHPGYKGWPDAGVDTAAEIAALVRDYGQDNVSILPREDELVLDVDADKENGASPASSLRTFEEQHGLDLPPTVTCVTPSGGLHLHYKLPPGEWRLKNKRLRDTTIDIRKSRGHAVSPPSVKSDGRVYAWQPGHGPRDMEVATLDAAVVRVLEELCAARRPLGQTTAGGSPRTPGGKLRQSATNAKQRLVELSETVSRAKEGGRRDALRNAAFEVGGFMDAAGLSDKKVAKRLLKAALQCGLDRKEAVKTIQDGLKDGRSKPLKAGGRSGYVILLPGHSAAAADKLEACLLRAGVPLYVYGDRLTELVRDRETGHVRLEHLTLARLDYLVSKHVRVVRKVDDRLVDASVPKRLLELILGKRSWGVPVITKVTRHPLVSEGQVFAAAGYDEENRAWVAPLSDHPADQTLGADRSAAEQALKEFLDLLTDFPFENERSLAAHLSALLTAVLRPSIVGCVPCFVYDAPHRGAGKTKLARIDPRQLLLPVCDDYFCRSPSPGFRSQASTSNLFLFPVLPDLVGGGRCGQPAHRARPRCRTTVVHSRCGQPRQRPRLQPAARRLSTALWSGLIRGVAP